MMTRVRTESAKSAVGALGAHFVMSMGYTDADLMQTFSLRKNTLCRLFAYSMQTMHKPRAHFVQTMKLVTWVALIRPSHCCI